MQIRQLDIPDLINSQLKQYSTYVLEERAIPFVIDGLKPVQRRALWMGHKYAKTDWVKVSKLGGLTMALHPHGDNSISDAISNMAQSFTGSNNISYFDGKGAFGSKIVGRGNGIGAPRYVSVRLSEYFEKLMSPDIELIKMKPSYDDNDVEPTHFLPIVPTILLNPVQGIAVGFATTIYPRGLKDIIHSQLQHLEGKGFHEPKIHFKDFEGTIEKINENVWRTTGVYKKDGRKMVITELPVGYTREKYVKHLDSLEEKEIISNYTDECTDRFLFNVLLKEDLPDSEIIEKFNLYDDINENINVISFNGKIRKMTATDIIKEFTEWRLKLYFERYKKQFIEGKAEFEYKMDLLKVMVKGLFKKFPELDKSSIIELLKDNSIKEEHIPKIIQTPIYKFGKEEIDTLRKELEQKKKYLENLVKLCKDETLRKEAYKQELKEIKL
jgi:DNA gyrase/topoisomerase IV subunit A